MQKNILFLLFLREKKMQKISRPSILKNNVQKKGGGFFRHFLIHLEEI